MSFVLLFSINVFGQNYKRTKRKLSPKQFGGDTTEGTGIKRRKLMPKQFSGDTTEGTGIRKKPKSKSKAIHSVKNSRIKKPVRNLEQSDGGLDMTDENAPFGERKANPKIKRSVRKKPKNKHNLLPYMEQSNVYRKPNRRRH